MQDTLISSQVVVEVEAPETYGIFTTLTDKGLKSLTTSEVEHIVSTTALAAFF